MKINEKNLIKIYEEGRKTISKYTELRNECCEKLIEATKEEELIINEKINNYNAIINDCIKVEDSISSRVQKIYAKKTLKK